MLRRTGINIKVRKSMTDKKGVIFDMDGTVWDSSENVANRGL